LGGKGTWLGRSVADTVMDATAVETVRLGAPVDTTVPVALWLDEAPRAMPLRPARLRPARPRSVAMLLSVGIVKDVGVVVAAVAWMRSVCSSRHACECAQKSTSTRRGFIA
jgi:hypothetical protein